MTAMNPMLTAALASIARWTLALGAGYLVKAGVWTEGDASGYVSAAALALVALGWSQWQKYSARRTLLTALTLPAKTTEAEVNRTVAIGVGIPSVLTPTDVVPSAEVR